MLRESPSTRQPRPSWQQQLADSFTSIADLCAYLQLDPASLPVSAEALKSFPLKVPRGFAQRMTKGDPADPLLRQILPVTNELIAYPGFTRDPVGDLEAAIMPGLLHKYQGRVLMINTGSCAINCRYCFRRNFPYGEQQLGKQDEYQVIHQIRAMTDINEVILSGGDPFTLSDARLKSLFQQLAGLPQLKRIRIHSRLPIVLPARMTDGLIGLLAETRQPMILVVHCNHANEIDNEVAAIGHALKRQGITLLNQAVLLKGINDSAQALGDLSEKLFAAGILPYYLHQLDKAEGTGHFEVADEVAIGLMATLRNRLPGYLVPKLVRETAGEKAKQPV